MFWMEICGRVRRGCEGLEINKSFFDAFSANKLGKTRMRINFGIHKKEDN